MVIEIITWNCPTCGFDNTDEINSDLGPFLSVTCGGCGVAVCENANMQDGEADANAVNATTETET